MRRSWGSAPPTASTCDVQMKQLLCYTWEVRSRLTKAAEGVNTQVVQQAGKRIALRDPLRHVKRLRQLAVHADLRSAFGSPVAQELNVKRQELNEKHVFTLGGSENLLQCEDVLLSTSERQECDLLLADEPGTYRPVCEARRKQGRESFGKEGAISNEAVRIVIPARRRPHVRRSPPSQVYSAGRAPPVVDIIRRHYSVTLFSATRGFTFPCCLLMRAA
jgi:hypothetical protein